MEQEIREALEKATKGPWDYEVDLVNDEWLTRWIGNGERIIVDNIERYNHETHEGYTSEQMDLDLYLIANAPTYLEWCLSQIAELRKENERLKTCPDCGGSGVVELCHDPLYTEHCICTVDFMGENRKLADEVNRLRKQIESKQDQNQGGSSKWTNTTNTP